MIKTDCAQCGSSFDKKSARHKYCSTQCSIDSKSKRKTDKVLSFKEKNCLVCQDIFMPKSGVAKYCSDSCRKSFRKNQQEKLKESGRDELRRKCVICGKEFIGRNKKAKNCSDECREISSSNYFRSVYESKKELIKARSKEYYSNNRELCIEKNKKYALENKDQSNFNKRQNTIKRKRMLDGKTIKFTKEELEKRWSYFGNKCVYCDSDNSLTEDHTKPISKGGWHCLSNLRPCCNICNSRKSASWFGPESINKTKERIFKYEQA